MTNRKQALTDLLTKVEAGVPNKNDGTLYKLFCDNWVHVWGITDRGSLDAAKALHEAVLPGWDVQIGTYEDDAFEASVSRPLEVKTYDGVSLLMARAWLIAILKALIAMEGEKMTGQTLNPKHIAEDREAGARGTWRVGLVDDTRVEDAHGNCVAEIDGDYNQPETWPVMEANARRIARVPDLEAHYLATLPLIEAADALAGAVADWAECDYENDVDGVIYALESALAAYRKAREGVGNE